MSTELTHREWWDLDIKPGSTPDDVIKLLAKLPINVKVAQPYDRQSIPIRFEREEQL